jgi:hypothetical protein
MTEHLLLGLMRADRHFASLLNPSLQKAIRAEIEKRVPREAQPGRARMDVPLSLECKRSLYLGSLEAEGLQHRTINSAHLALGLLRQEDCTAAKLLREHGMDYSRLLASINTVVPDRPPRARQRPVERAIDRPAPWYESAGTPPVASLLQPSNWALENLLDSMGQHLNLYSDSYGDRRLKRKPWTRKEAFGHLIDWGIAHQQWLSLAVMDSKLAALGFPWEEGVAVQRYAEFPWQETVDLWVSVNWLLIHTLRRVPEDKLDVPCRIGIARPVPLAKLVDAYVEHCDDMAGQILALLFR